MQEDCNEKLRHRMQVECERKNQRQKEINELEQRLLDPTLTEEMDKKRIREQIERIEAAREQRTEEQYLQPTSDSPITKT